MLQPWIKHPRTGKWHRIAWSMPNCMVKLRCGGEIHASYNRQPMPSEPTCRRCSRDDH